MASRSARAVAAAKEGEKELKRRTKDNRISVGRAAQIRGLVTKHFGELSKLTLASVEIDTDDEATPAEPAYGEVDLHLTAADGTALKIGVDDIIQINGTWKFKGRLEDDLNIKMAEIE
jgi:hypothetical protein